MAGRARPATLVPMPAIRCADRGSNVQNHRRTADEWTGIELRFELSEKDGGTEVRLTHEGLVPDHDEFQDSGLPEPGNLSVAGLHGLLCDEFLPDQCVPTTTAGSAELDQLS